jgi:hypothetical protein
MAYPTVSAPYGLIPINLIGGQVYAGAIRHFSIASGYAAASGAGIFFGDIVRMVADGTVAKDATTNAPTAGGPVGIFLGCSFTDPVYGKTFRQFYPNNTVATDIRAFVADDPDILFKVAVVSGTTVIASVTRAAIGMNGALVQNNGNPATGNSANALSSTLATTSTLPLRVIDVVNETQSTPGNYTEVICKFNAGVHAYNNPTGF